MLSEKYIAGFIDADGYVGVRCRVGAKPDLDVVVAQKTIHRRVLDDIQDQFGGHILDKAVGNGNSVLGLRGQKAYMMLSRLKKYMVLKRHHAERMMELVDSSTILTTPEEVKEVRDKVKQIRAYGADRMPNYPSRKWLAGYFDGDGCFTVSVDRYGKARPVASIMAAQNYVVGVSLVSAVFGGRINAVGTNAYWQLCLDDPSKAIKFIDFFAQHLEIKKAQAYFLLGCARQRNFRDGKAISTAIKTLNAQQHRLSEPTSEAHRLLQTVDFTIPALKVGRPKGVKDSKPRKKRQSETSV
jgi:hypothetical protein